MGGQVSLSNYTIPRFGSLNLVDDPQEVGAQGATDLLNVDFEKRGRIRTRDGFDNFTSAAAAARYADVVYFTMIAGNRNLVSARRTGTTITFQGISTSGTSVATQGSLPMSATDPFFMTSVRYGGPATEVLYVAGVTVGTVIGTEAQCYKWDSVAWAVSAGPGNVVLFGLQPTDNRVVMVKNISNVSRVMFSGPGTPETFGANDYVELTPGDGGTITALANYQNLLFVFKSSGRFFVFTGNSTSGTGTPVFNYRSVDGVGCVSWLGATAGRDGVYFIDKRGIYRTRSGPAELVSGPLDPLFRGIDGTNILAINQTYLPFAKITYHDERIYVAVPTGTSTINDKMLVYSPNDNYWTVWDIPAGGICSAPMGSSLVNELFFSYATGSNHLGRQSSTYTDDDGTAITARYQSGFYELSPGNRAKTRWTHLWGSGAPVFDVYTDHATSDPLTRGGEVTLGTSPVVAKGVHNKAYKGDLFSHKLSSTSGAWSVNRIQHDIAETSKP